MSLFPTPRIGRAFGCGTRTVPSSPRRHRLTEGSMKLLDNVYSPFFIRTACMKGVLEFGVFSGSGCCCCLGFCGSVVVSATAFWVVMFEPY